MTETPLETDLPAVAAEHGLDVGGLRFHRRYPYELRANWKVAVENYLECYHCALNHPGFVDAVDERALRLEDGGARLSQFAPVHPRALATRGAVRRARRPCDEPVPPPAAGDEVQRVPRPAEPLDRAGVAARARPLRRLPRLLLRAGRRRGLDRRVLGVGFRVGAEDVALVEAVQAGAGSGALADGRLLGATEVLIAALQAYVCARVEPALS